MAQTDFIPALWQARITKNLEALNVFSQIVTTEYSGQMGYGNKVTLLTPKSVTVRDYAGTITWENGDAEKIELNVDNRKYFAVKVDDLTELQSNMNLLDRYAADGARKLAGEVEEEVVSSLAAVHEIQTTANTLFAGVAQAAAYLASKRWGKTERWMVVSPDVLALMLTDPRITATADAGRESGVVGRTLGFDVYSSPTVPANTALFGVNGALAIVGDIEKIDATTFEDSFDIGVRGWYAFGVKVVEPDGVGRISVTV